jgi:hypothetical protein
MDSKRATSPLSYEPRYARGDVERSWPATESTAVDTDTATVTPPVRYRTTEPESIKSARPEPRPRSQDSTNRPDPEAAWLRSESPASDSPQAAPQRQSVAGRSTEGVTKQSSAALPSRPANPPPDLPGEEYTGPSLLRRLPGFPRTAHFLASDPDKSWVVFRRFDEASIRNLLYLEARVAALEKTQREMDAEDFDVHITKTAALAAAGSWENFAMLGMDYAEAEELWPAMDGWMSEREKAMERDCERYATWYGDVDPWPNPEAQQIRVARYQLQQYRQQGGLHRWDQPGYDVNMRRRFLGYDESDRLLIERRWRVARALQKALQDYGRCPVLLDL